jgi:hypothetical protein
LPETYLVACVVDYFDSSPEFQSTSDKTGIKTGETVMSYKSLFTDIRGAVDWVHFNSEMKQTILDNLDIYVDKDERAPQMLKELRAADRKTFLLTNSDYPYTNGIMSYLLGKDWTSYFDIVGKIYIVQNSRYSNLKRFSFSHKTCDHFHFYVFSGMGSIDDVALGSSLRGELRLTESNP